MNILLIFRIAFRALARNKMRSALTMLGIVIGVSAVIAMVSIGQGAQAQVQEQVANVGTNLLFVGAGSQNVGGVRSGTGATNSNRLTVEDIDGAVTELKAKGVPFTMEPKTIRPGVRIAFLTAPQGVSIELIQRG